MKIKHYDESLGKWVIDGSSNATDLELDNPGFITDQGAPVSVDNAFTKTDNRITRAEQNIIWLAHNKGEGGGGGTGPGESYALKVLDGDVIYTSTSSATVNIMIESGGVKKSFTVIAKNLDTNQVIGTWKKYSMSKTDITLTDLKDTVNIELSAYDANNKYASPAYIKIVSGAISLSIQKIPPKTMYIGGINEVPLNFTINNNILESDAEFNLTINNIEVYKLSNITTSIRDISLDARKLLFQSEHFNPKAGQKFIFKAQASTLLKGELLKSQMIIFDITVADSNSLIIVTEDITEFIPSETEGETIGDLTSFTQGSQLAFNYYFSCGLTSYYTFNMNYQIDLMENTSEGTSLVKTIYNGEVKNINKGENNRFSYSTVNMEMTSQNQFIKLTMFGYAVNDPGDKNAQYTKVVTCRITEAQSIDLYANNDMHTLLAYFSRVTGFPNTSTGTWNYPIKTSGPFIYEGAFGSKFPNGVNLTLKKVNGKTNGFLIDSDGVNSIPAIRLEGESYGYLEVADQMFPQLEISSGVSFFQSSGFCISTTFKADTTSNPDETILSIGKYDNDGLLKTGYEITVEKVTCKIGSADTLICKLPQNKLLTVDLDVSLLVGTGWYFKLYLNGTASQVTKVNESDIDWMFGTDLYLGCRNDNGKLSRFSNVSFYDFKLYTSSQSEYAVVQNWMSATEQAKLKLGQIDQNLDTELRLKNLFDSAGNCLIWDKLANGGRGSYLEGERLYNKLLEQMEINTPYPMLLVEETSNSSTLFEAYSTAIFSASDKHEIMGKTFPCKATYIDNKGKCFIKTPIGVMDDFGVRIGIQGTSSLSYNSKNFELYLGAKDPEGNDLLFTPKDEWLPENRFTLKADVMDSSHVNNVVIGKIINGEVKNEQGNKVTPFAATPPMALGNDVWGGDAQKAESIRSKFKHTSDGFPCLLFIRFAPDKNGNTQQPKFMGIYNFNLGRYALNNLGLRLLTDYTKEVADGPSLVYDYTVNNNYWDKQTGEGVYSMEINQNSSAQGAFQQDDMKIVQFMADVAYTSKDNSSAYNSVKKFYNQMANMALTKIQKYTMDDAGQSPTKPIPGEFYDLDKNAYYNFDACDKHLNWDNACAYFIIAIIFGMVDSMCKNLTIRNWGSSEWYTAFYDMDTAFSLNNAGQDIVAYWAHLHRWFNINQADTNITTYTLEKNYTSTDDVKQYYASWWNRIWEILENLSGMDSGSTTNRASLETVYVNLRTNLFPDPDVFIDKYYKGYTENTGSIMFNYDYNIKYLKLAKTYDINTGEYQDSTDFSQLKFLHGNRVMYVRDWFKKRILFLDGIYGIQKDNVLIPITIQSPINTLWASNKVTGSNLDNKFGTNIKSASKILYRYSFDKTSGSFWIDEKDQNAIVPIPQGETVLYMYANKYITEFDKFKMYPWTGLDNINLPLLETLDLSGLTNVDAGYFFRGGVYDKVNDIGLKNIRTLILNNVKLIGDKASAYTLDLTNCNKLQELDVSSSTITKVKLSETAVLKKFNLSNTDITELVLTNQSFLETVLIDNCNLLTKIEISNCASLKTLNIPKNVNTIIIRNCESLEYLNIPFISINNSISPLYQIVIDNCPGLKIFDINGQNNKNLDIQLVGAWNLEELNIAQTNYKKLTLPALMVNGNPNFTSLKKLNISKTKITTLEFNDQTFDYLELTSFPDLDSILATDCSNLKIIKCKNDRTNPITLKGYSFSGVSTLERIYGHFELSGNDIFKDCGNFILNESNIYDRFGTNEFLEGTEVTNISFDEINNTYISAFEGCTSLSYNDFKYIMVRLKPNIVTLEKLFKGCSNITGAIWYDIFRYTPNLDNIKEIFSSTKLSGIFYSRKSNYSETDDTTWGILDFLPKVRDAEGAFSNTSLEWIDNNVFAPIVVNGTTKYSPLIKVTGMFRGCGSLKSCIDTQASVIEVGNLRSEDFFINLDNVLELYPRHIFHGCTKINMEISEDSEGNTLLYHCKVKPNTLISLDNSLYAGINLIGEIKPNVFGGITDTVKNGKYFIPDFNTIKYPFEECNSKLTIDISTMDNIFNRLKPNLRQAIGIFKNLKLTGVKKLPSNIFKGCILLNNIQEIFSGLELDYQGQEFEFPIKGMFDDCVELQIITGILKNTNSYKIKLIGEQFKNCKLTNVSEAFSYSSIYGFIPYRLFFMSRNNIIQRTINNMFGVFEGCYCLGYDKSRELNIGETLTANSSTTWEDHVVKTKGNELNYKLDVSKMEKSYNYDSSDGTLSFDEWYLDGYGWENATAKNPEEQEELNTLKNSLMVDYFNYDIEQKQVIINQESSGLFKDTYQNYMIPTDLFRYCDDSCNLSNILSTLNWKEHIITENLETGDKVVTKTSKIEGLKGRIPTKLLKVFSEKEDLEGLFTDTNFEAFVGFNGGSVMKRGIMYPPDLFKYNLKVLNLSSCFKNTEISVGVDINDDLFKNNVLLKNISSMWNNCKFDNREYNLPGVLENQPQLNFSELFKMNTKISTANNLFAVSELGTDRTGLFMITPDLLKLSYNINDISGMFLNNARLKGAVPLFQAASYPYLKLVSSYLTGVMKSNITNADQLEPRLIPQEWL